MGANVLGATMMRERALQVVLVVLGVLFVATIYPLVAFIRQEPALAMMLSLYVTLGVFLLLAVRNPAAHRSLILFTAWSSLAHAAVMAYQGMRGMIAHHEMFGVAVLAVFGVVLIALAPAKPAPMDKVAG
jgi:succinate-acetate transporter protein